MDVVVLKMIGGEELIAEFDAGSNTFKRPRILTVQETERGMRAGLVPWLMTDPEASVSINADHIAARFVAPKQVADSYAQSVSGIELAQSLRG